MVANHFVPDTDEAIFECPHCFDTDRWIRESACKAHLDLVDALAPGFNVGQNSVSRGNYPTSLGI